MISNNNFSNNELPLMALKNVALFPRIAMPLVVQRPKSVVALEQALSANNGQIIFVAQKNLHDNASPKDLFKIGTIGLITSANRLPDGSFKIEAEGVRRVKILEFIQEEPFFKAKTEPVELEYQESVESEALIRTIIDQFKKVTEAKIFSSVLPSFLFTLGQIKEPEQLINLIAVNLNLDLIDQQYILETPDLNEALKRINFFLTRELEILEAEKKVAKETKKELGMEGEKGEYEQLRAKIKKSGMPKEVEKKASKELNRLEKMPMFSPEISYLRTYLDWLVELPWSVSTRKSLVLKQAEKVLNRDHYGLDKVKERILEYLAVQKQVGKVKGPILCFIGPPGTGKTSI